MLAEHACATRSKVHAISANLLALLLPGLFFFVKAGEREVVTRASYFFSRLTLAPTLATWPSALTIPQTHHLVSCSRPHSAGSQNRFESTEAC